MRERRLWGRTGSWVERIGSDRVINGNDPSSHLGISLRRSADGAIKAFELNYYAFEHCLEWDGHRMHYHHFSGDMSFAAAYSSPSTWKMFTEDLKPAAVRMGLASSDVDDILAILYREAE